MKTLAIIPARFASTRFPGKPLVEIQGKTMIQRVFEKATASKMIDQVVVATDDQRIYDQVISFGGQAMMTSPDHPSGTDRCGEVAAQFSDFETIINIQGDEPFVPTAMIEELIIAFKKAKELKIATLVKQIEASSDLFNPNIVKVVADINDRALYFSRQAIPYQRDVAEADWLKKQNYFKHIGMYIFARKTLLELIKLPTGQLEEVEKLEQLRWLENGYAIGLGFTKYESVGIDTPEDLRNLNFKS